MTTEVCYKARCLQTFDKFCTHIPLLLRIMVLAEVLMDVWMRMELPLSFFSRPLPQPDSMSFPDGWLHHSNMRTSQKESASFLFFLNFCSERDYMPLLQSCTPSIHPIDPILVIRNTVCGENSVLLLFTRYSRHRHRSSRVFNSNSVCPAYVTVQL